MDALNLPPFYPGQKVVAIISSKCKKIKKGVVYTAAFCVESACKCKHSFWDVGIKEVKGFEDASRCHKCGFTTYHKGKFYFIGMASAFVPLEETFQPITLEKVLENETGLICVN